MSLSPPPPFLTQMWALQVTVQKIQNLQPERPDFIPSFSFAIFYLIDDCNVQKFAVCTTEEEWK